MFSLILHGRRSLELQKFRNLGISVQNVSAFSKWFSAARFADMSHEDGRKGKTFTVSYLVKSWGFNRKLAESISRKVSSKEKRNAMSVLNLLSSHGFNKSHISSISRAYPGFWKLDAEKSLAPKLQFLRSRGASSSELTKIVMKVPKILGKKGEKTISIYYDFIKEIIKTDKSSKYEMPQCQQKNKFRNLLVLKELGMPQKLLLPLIISRYNKTVCGKENFDASIKKVVEMGFDPSTSKFLSAVRIVYGFSNKTIEEKVNVYKRLGFTVGDVWAMFKKKPLSLRPSEIKITKSMKTYLGLGFTRDEIAMMVKHFPSCLWLSAESVKRKVQLIVKNMNWPMQSLFENVSAFANSFSSTHAANVSPKHGHKRKTFTVSYLDNSLSLTSRKLAESISRKVSSEDKGNAVCVLNLLSSHGFTNSQICSISKAYPRLLKLDAEKSLAPKLQFLRSRGASRSELTEIIMKVPKILGKKGEKTISIYYDFIKEIIKADKNSKYEMPQCWQENNFRNLLVLKELGMPQELLLPLVISKYKAVFCGKENFDASINKVVEMGFDPTTSKFVYALRIVYRVGDKKIDNKVNAYKRLGFTVDDVWEMFKKNPHSLTYSETKIAKSMETYLSLGFTREEIVMMVKCFPSCLFFPAESVKKKVELIVKNMNWPLESVISYPVLLGYSMEKRMVPRCNVVKALMSKGLLRREIPTVFSVLTCTDEVFLNKYVINHDDKQLVAELMAIFAARGRAL